MEHPQVVARNCCVEQLEVEVLVFWKGRNHFSEGVQGRELNMFNN